MLGRFKQSKGDESLHTDEDGIKAIKVGTLSVESVKREDLKPIHPHRKECLLRESCQFVENAFEVLRQVDALDAAFVNIRVSREQQENLTDERDKLCCATLALIEKHQQQEQQKKQQQGDTAEPNKEKFVWKCRNVIGLALDSSQKSHFLNIIVQDHFNSPKFKFTLSRNC